MCSRLAVVASGLLLAQAGGDDCSRLVWRPTDAGELTLAGSWEAGPELLACEPSGRVSLWRASQEEGWNCVAALLANAEAAAVSPDGRWIASGNGAGRLWLWDGADAWAAYELRPGLGSSVTRLVFSEDGRMLAAGAANGELGLWSIDPPAPLRAARQVHGTGISAIAFAPDGSGLASGDWKGMLHAWRWDPSGAYERSWQAHDGGVDCLALSSSGRLASASAEDLRLWDPAQEEVELERLSRADEGSVLALDLSPDGESLRVACESTWVATRSRASRSWVAESRCEDRRIDGWLTASLRLGAGLGFAEEGLVLTDLGAPRHELPAFATAEQSVRCAAIARDGSRVALLDRQGGVELWSIERRELDGRIEPDPLRLRTSLALAPDASHLACGLAAGAIELWTLASAPARLRDWSPHASAVHCLCFSDDGRLLASTDESGRIRISTVEGEVLPRHPLSSDSTRCGSSFWPNRSEIVYSVNTGVLVHWSWTGEGGARNEALPALDSCRDGIRQLWTSIHGPPLHAWPAEERWTPTAIACSRDGALLACTDDRGWVHLLEARELRFLASVQLPQISALAFVGDALWLVHSDRTLRVLDRSLGAVECFELAGKD